MVRTGPDPTVMKATAPVPAERRGRPHLVAYLGVMGPQDGVDVALAAADHVVHGLGRTDVSFTLMGGGDCYDDLVAERDRLGLQDYVELPGRVPDAYVSDVLSTADVGLSPDPLNPLNDVSTMNKTMEYMAFGLPVVAFDLVETRVSAGDAAVYADPASGAQGLAEALVGLLDDDASRSRMGTARPEAGRGTARLVAPGAGVPRGLRRAHRARHRPGIRHSPPTRGRLMKVVLFCGGLGMRMRADNQSLPKPMMPIGSRPVLWHIMRYFAHFGHTEFILCLGHGAAAVKDYFLDYRETTSNDFVLTKGGQHVDMLGTDISDWTITFIDTGLDTAIGERLRRVRPYLEGDQYFLANYGDVLTDAPMNDLIDQFVASDAVAQFITVKPQDSFHVVEADDEGRVTGLVPAADLPFRINGGYFVLSDEIFDYLEEGEDLVMDGCVKAASGRPDPRCPPRRVLGRDGHAQGAEPPRGHAPPWVQPVGRLAKPEPRRTMTTSTLRAPARARATTARVDRRVLLAWGALFLNVLAFGAGPMIVPIPGPVGQLFTQGAILLAFVLALAANPQGLLRPNLYVVVLSIMSVVALMVSLHNEFYLGSTYRALRFIGFVAVLWLLTPFWGRRDLLLLRCYRVYLWVVLGSVALGAAVAPGLALSFDGRLSGVVWPIWPTQVAHYAAVLLGSSVILWMCRIIIGRHAALTVAVTGTVLLATHTRTALLAGSAGLICASASLLIARSRARRTWLFGGVVAVAGVALFASEVTGWLLRDQTNDEALQGSPGRTAVWAMVTEEPRSTLEVLFGSGMSNLSFNGLAIDSNWVGTYLDLGRARDRGPGRHPAEPPDHGAEPPLRSRPRHRDLPDRLLHVQLDHRDGSQRAHALPARPRRRLCVSGQAHARSDVTLIP